MKNSKFENRLRYLSAIVLAIFTFQMFASAGYFEVAIFALLVIPFGPKWGKHIPGARFGLIGTGAPTPEELLLEKVEGKALKAAADELNRLITKSPLMTKETFDLQFKNFEEKYKDLDKVTIMVGEVKSLALELKALKESSGGNAVGGTKEQVSKWMEANKDAITAIKSGEKASLTGLVIKVNSPMTPANTYNSSAYLPQPEFQIGATEIVRVQPTFWDYIKKGRTKAAAYVWVNKKNPLGAAGFIGPGVAKPGISFEIATEISNAKKVAVSEKCSTELLEDIDGMQSWIEQELAYQLKQKINTTLMTGVSSSTVPAGIQTISTAFSLTTISTTNPNNWDAVVAAVAQLRAGNLVGQATAFMNPIDIANMKLAKAISQGQYLNNTPELGATIVEDNNIPVGYIQVALLDYYKILIYKEFAITFGWENDDFTKNLVTAIAEMRLHQFFSENHTGAFIYDTLSNIKTAITAAP